MPTIRATCADCGDVELEIIDVTVRLCVDTDTSTYLFRCPTCTMATVLPAQPRVVDVLVAAGVRLVRWHLPPELSERHEGPLFTHDDVLDFHLLLADPADPWLQGLHDGRDDLG